MFENIFPKYITVKNIVFFVITILFITFLFKVQDIAIMFFASYVIACSLNPLADKLSKKMKRSKAAAIVLCAFILIICAFFIPLVYIAAIEIKSFALHLPNYLENIKDLIMTKYMHTTDDFISGAGIVSSASKFTSDIFSGTVTAGKQIGTSFVYLIVSIIITYYFMADKELIRKTCLSLFPNAMQKKAENIINTISEKIGGYVIAQITTMASVGLIMAIGLSIIRVEYAVLLGFITAICDIIPVIGPAFALIICLIAAFKSGPVVLIMITVVFAIAQLCENNLVRPYVFGKFMNLHPIIIYLFLFLTAKYIGIIGVVFAPAIAATVVVLIEELYIKNIK